MNIWEKLKIQGVILDEEIYYTKWEYNYSLKRLKKAEALMEKLGGKFFENDKYKVAYFDIIQVLSLSMKEYKRLTGKAMTQNETLEGFDIVDRYAEEKEAIMAKYHAQWEREMLSRVPQEKVI